MTLIIGLAVVDRVNGERQTRHLADGWMGRESQRGRHVRALVARVLAGLAAWLDPARLRALVPGRGATDARATS